MFYSVPQELKEISEIFHKNNFSLYLVGGAVRDFVMNKANHDYDLATDARPEEVKSIFKKTIDTGIKHGTVTILYKKNSYEVTTFRTESDYTDSRHPDSVSFVRSLDEDLKRRDFTINALAVSLPDGLIIDKHNGLEDIEKKTIRAIGEAEERFKEDALRMLRACRFASKLSFTIEENTLLAIKKLNKTIEKVSVERIKEELDKTLTSTHPSLGLSYMKETGLLSQIIPILTINEDILSSLDRQNTLSVQLSILFSSLKSEEVKDALKRLKSSNKEKEEVLLLLSSFSFPYKEDISDYEIRLILRKVGKENIDSFFALRDALKVSTDDSSFKNRIEEEIRKNTPLFIKDLDITGNDLIKTGKEGKEIGDALEYLMTIVLKNPEKNRKEILLEEIKTKKA